MNCFDCQSVTGINGNYYLEKHFTFIWNKAKKTVANICSVDIFNVSYTFRRYFSSRLRSFLFAPFFRAQSTSETIVIQPSIRWKVNESLIEFRQV